jgi:hypothetical protein
MLSDAAFIKKAPTSTLETISNGGIEAGRPNQFHEKSSSLAAVLIAQFAYTPPGAQEKLRSARQREVII